MRDHATTEPITPDTDTPDTTATPVPPSENHPDTTSKPITPAPQGPNRADRRAALRDHKRSNRKLHRAARRFIAAKRLTQFSLVDVDTLADEAEPHEVDASRLALRAEHDSALEALMAEVEQTVADALDRTMRAALNNLGAGITAAAGAPGVVDLQALSAITNLWLAEINGPVGSAIADVFLTGGLASWFAYPSSYDAAVEAFGDLDEVLNAHAAEYLAMASNRLVGIGDTAWATARHELEAGFRAGEGINELRERVQRVLRTSESRARIIARTETVSASNAGTLRGVRTLGRFGPQQKQWLATGDSRTRDTHYDADGQTVPVDDYFEVGGASLDFPGDPGGSAAEVVNCRCTVTFVDAEGGAVDEGDLTEEQTDQLDALEASGGQMARKQKATGLASSFTSAGAGALGTALGIDLTRPSAQRLEVDEAETEEIITPVESRPGTPMKDAEEADGFPPEQWHSLMVVEGVPTGDRRLIEEGALTWRDLPLPLMWQETQPETGGHALSVHVGQTTRIERQGAEIHAWGFFLSDDEDGQRFVDLLTQAQRLGVSVDMDDVDVEIDWPDEEEDEDGMMFFPEPDLVRFTRARLMGHTAVPFPAFSEAFIELLEAPAVEETPEEEVPPVNDDEEAALIASVIPVEPPMEWFDNPNLSERTPQTVQADGRVFGHLASWGQCHTGYPGMCFTAPTSPSQYAYFRTGEVLCAGGERVAVGQITLGGPHADTHNRNPRAAMAHYDNTTTAVADVSVGEDAHGIWFAGALRPEVTPEQVRQLRGASLSGDWRRVDGRLELIAALAVNVPGYPIPRTSAAQSGGVQTALVAAGIVMHDGAHRPPTNNLDAIAERIAASVGRDHRSRADKLAARVHAGVGAMACLPCAKNRARLAGVERAPKAIVASASTTRYEVKFPDGHVETHDTLLAARRLSIDGKPAHGGRGVIKVI